MSDKETVKKIAIIVSKNTLEDVYAGLVMANGAVMDGIETIMFFTFFGLDAITKKTMNDLKVGSPESFMAKMPPMDSPMPENVTEFVTEKIKEQFESMDFPPVDEFMEMINGGGALGNLYDRIFQGYVVDFLDFYIKQYHYPAFNLADTFITLGIFVLVLYKIKVK